MSRKTEYYINTLVALIYNWEPAPELGSCTNKLYKLSGEHNMSVMVGNFIKKYFPERYTDRMKEENTIRTALHLMQKAEYKKLAAELDYRKIKYIPLKGIRLSKMYPKNMLREMSDIDILVHQEDIPEITEIMKNAGYEHQHSGHHEIYKNQDNVCFEIHTKLIDEKRNNSLEQYFDNVWEGALRSGNGSGYVMSPEDEYIYLLAHLYGHFHMGGCGVRYILDIWIYMQENLDMDFELIDKILKIYKMKRFSDNILKLGKVWFEGAKPSEVTDELGEYIISSGTYGRTEQYSLSVADEGNSAMASILKRKIFLSSDEMKKRYPWIRCRLLVPIGYIYRIIDMAVNKKGKIGEYAKSAAGVNENAVREYRQMMNKFGVRSE